MSNTLKERRINKYVKLNPELCLDGDSVPATSLQKASKDLNIHMVDIMMYLRYGKIF